MSESAHACMWKIKKTNMQNAGENAPENAQKGLSKHKHTILNSDMMVKRMLNSLIFGENPL